MKFIIFPISVMVRDNSNYEERAMVQLDNEWIIYEKKYDNSFFIFELLDETIKEFIRKGQFSPPYRGIKNTLHQSHPYGTKVLPVFQTNLGWQGRFDRVTIIDGEKPEDKEEQTINWAIDGYVAFSDDVSKLYNPGNTRILKFPSGELPISNKSPVWGETIYSVKSPSFILDKPVLLQTKSKFSCRLIKTLDSQSNQILVNSSSSLPEDGGIIKIGDEYIGYREGKENLNDVERGFIETQKSSYSSGTNVFPVFFIATSTLLKPSNITSPFMLKNSNDFPDEGYVKCNKEIIGYYRKYCENLDMGIGKNIYDNKPQRGCFGTEPSTHLIGDIVYSLPMRYWDRALPNKGSISAYFQASKEAPDAIWKSITWEIEPADSDYVGVYLLGRFDGKPSWEENPTNKKGGIFRWDAPQDKLNIKADSMEIRVYFTYKKNSYSEGFWKKKTLFKRLCVEYEQDSKIWE